MAAQQSAGSITYDANQVVNSVDMRHLSAIVAERGETVIEQGENAPWMVIRNRFDENLLIEAMHCDERVPTTQCRGLLLRRTFTPNPDIDPANVAAVNAEFLTMKTYLKPDGELVVERYVILEEGVTMANILFNIDIVYEGWNTIQPYVLGEKSITE